MTISETFAAAWNEWSVVNSIEPIVPEPRLIRRSMATTRSRQGSAAEWSDERWLDRPLTDDFAERLLGRCGPITGSHLHRPPNGIRDGKEGTGGRAVVRR